jgi:hypothetical protein
MAGAPGEEYAKLLAEVFAWFTDPTKFAQLKLEAKLDKLSTALTTCLNNRDLVAADLIYAELRKLSQGNG